MPTIAVQKIADPDKMPLSLSDSMQKIFDQIREKAFCLFCESGSTHGHAVDDWLKAEREIFQTPESELLEKNNEFTLQIAAPGFEAKDLDITALPSSIIVRGESTMESGKVEGKVHFSDFRNQQLYRRYALPAPIDVDKTMATLEKGILKIVAQRASAQLEKVKVMAA